MELLAEVEEKKKLNLDLNEQLKKHKLELEEKDRIISDLKVKNEDFKNKLSNKELTVASLRKDNDDLEREKEEMIREYHRTIDELQLKIFYQASDNADPGYLLRIIEMLNENIEESNMRFLNKIENLNDYLINFKSEIRNSESKYMNLIGDKIRFNQVQIKKFRELMVNSASLSSEELTSHSLAKRIDLLSKKVSELSATKNKIFDSRKLEEAQKEYEESEKKLLEVQEEIRRQQIDIREKNETIAALEKKSKETDREYEKMKKFMESYMPKEVYEKFFGMK